MIGCNYQKRIANNLLDGFEAKFVQLVKMKNIFLFNTINKKKIIMTLFRISFIQLKILEPYEISASIYHFNYFK
jgi:hypothetical protein